MKQLFQIARKEFGAFFSSPIAFIFFGAFLAVTLFIFFWVETFFARNIADVRPLFSWMPVLLIFLTAAITMRMWCTCEGSRPLVGSSRIRMSGWCSSACATPTRWR